MTGAEQITQAFIQRLTVPPMLSVAPALIHRDLVRAVDYDGGIVSIAVEEGDEPSPLEFVIGRHDRTLEIRVSVIGKGRATAGITDPALSEAHARIMADRTLGGIAIDLTEGETTRQREAMEQPVLVVTKTYRVSYRTADDALEII